MKNIYTFIFTQMSHIFLLKILRETNFMSLKESLIMSHLFLIKIQDIRTRNNKLNIIPHLHESISSKTNKLFRKIQNCNYLWNKNNLRCVQLKWITYSFSVLCSIFLIIWSGWNIIYFCILLLPVFTHN